MDFGKPAMAVSIVAIIVAAAGVGLAFQSLTAVQDEQKAVRQLVEEQLKAAQQKVADVEARNKLIEAARREGSVTYYGPADTAHWINTIVPAFQKEYPFINFNYVEIAPTQSWARLTSEYQGGVRSADLFQTTVPKVREATRLGMATAYRNPYASLYPKGLVDPDYGYPFNLGGPWVIAYNTNLVKESEAPKKWDELADPKWKGQIVWGQNPITLGGGGIGPLELRGQFGEQWWSTWSKGLAANKPVFTGSMSQAYNLVLRGEYKLGTVYGNDVLSQKPGTPVAIAWTNPVVVIPNWTFLVSNAPHPNAAKLFLEWLASPAGQLAVANTGRLAVLPTLEHPTALKNVLPRGIEAVANKFPDVYDNPDKYVAEFKTIFGIP